MLLLSSNQLRKAMKMTTHVVVFGVGHGPTLSHVVVVGVA